MAQHASTDKSSSHMTRNAMSDKRRTGYMLASAAAMFAAARKAFGY
jgi:hypothetical protein